jgi:hypothetical protein
MIVVTPTLKVAQVAATEVGASAFSAARLVHQHGFRWDADGRWTRAAVDRIDLADEFSRVVRSNLNESFEVQFERLSALVGG